MGDQPRYRPLVETEEYTAKFDFIIRKYSEDVLDPVLRGLFWGIVTNPKEHSRTIHNLRVAKSASLGLTIPTFRIFFQIENEGKEDEYVLLCWIEEINPIDEIIR